MKNICLVGCGNIGRLHAKNLSGAAALFFCSRSKESAERFNDDFQGQGVFAHLDEVLASPEVDAVLIASPPAFHKDQILSALAAGKAVLVEKPMCVSLAEVAEVAAALEAAPDSLLMVAENYYYKPSLGKLKSLVQEGAIGDVQSVSVKKLSTQSASGWKRGYGALLEGGIHFVALISDLLEANPEQVVAEFPGREQGESERFSVTKLTYSGGVTAELKYSWSTPSLTKGVLQHSYIRGTKGKITFESNGIYVLLRRGFRTRLFFPGMADLMGYGAMIQDFLHCLEDRSRKPYSDFSRARRDLQIVFEAYEEL